ncbi:DUF5959 family protein [Streptomyces sindenensis]|uniref:DUF5959 family protein n=1 Tax=Streptomyces sindenensis TaxID=67363 RepID=A0ABW6EPI0_9ACTN
MESPAAPTVPRPAAPTAARPELPITTTAPVKRERRWSVAALCVVLAAVAGLGAAAAVTSAGDRTKVLAVARDVPAGQALTEADLVVAEVSADAALSPVSVHDGPSSQVTVSVPLFPATGWIDDQRARLEKVQRLFSG